MAANSAVFVPQKVITSIAQNVFIVRGEIGYANANAVVYTTGGVPFSLEGLVPSEATTKHVSIRSANAAGLSQASYGYVPNAAISSGAVQIFVSGSEVTGNITSDVIVFEAYIAKV